MIANTMFECEMIPDTTSGATTRGKPGGGGNAKTKISRWRDIGCLP